MSKQYYLKGPFWAGFRSVWDVFGPIYLVLAALLIYVYFFGG